MNCYLHHHLSFTPILVLSCYNDSVDFELW